MLLILYSDGHPRRGYLCVARTDSTRGPAYQTMRLFYVHPSTARKAEKDIIIVTRLVLGFQGSGSTERQIPFRASSWVAWAYMVHVMQLLQPAYLVHVQLSPRTVYNRY